MTQEAGLCHHPGHHAAAYRRDDVVARTNEADHTQDRVKQEVRGNLIDQQLCSNSPTVLLFVFMQETVRDIEDLEHADKARRKRSCCSMAIASSVIHINQLTKATRRAAEAARPGLNMS